MAAISRAAPGFITRLNSSQYNAVVSGNIQELTNDLTHMVLQYVKTNPDIVVPFETICKAYDGNSRNPTNRAAALTILAVALEKGEVGLPRNPKRAAEFAREAVLVNGGVYVNKQDEITVVALNIAARAASNEGDFEKAVDLWKQAADLKDPEAMVEIAHCFSQGKGVSNRDDSIAFFWYKKAAELGNSEGMYGIAYALTKGRGTIADENRAWHWYKKAAENGHLDAMNVVGRRYLSVGDYRAAIVWLEQAANLGSPEAIISLGFIYGKGVGADQGIPQDYQKARDCFEGAAALNYPLAHFELFILYSQGRGVEQNYPKAWQLLNRGSDLGCHHAKKRLAEIYGAGDPHFGITKDSQIAARYCKESLAIHPNDARLQFQLGCFYYTGVGVDYTGEGVGEQSFEEAFVCFMKALECGSAAGAPPIIYSYLTRIGSYFSEEGPSQDFNKAFKCFRMAAEAGDLDGMRNLASCYREGRGTTINEEAAGHWENRVRYIILTKT